MKHRRVCPMLPTGELRVCRRFWSPIIVFNHWCSTHPDRCFTERFFVLYIRVLSDRETTTILLKLASVLNANLFLAGSKILVFFLNLHLALCRPNIFAFKKVWTKKVPVPVMKDILGTGYFLLRNHCGRFRLRKGDVEERANLGKRCGKRVEEPTKSVADF